MKFEDKVLKCQDENCKSENQEFVWTAGEQEFYAERNMSEPKRCKSCRDARKASMNANRRPRNNYERN